MRCNGFNGSRWLETVVLVLLLVLLPTWTFGLGSMIQYGVLNLRYNGPRTRIRARSAATIPYCMAAQACSGALFLAGRSGIVLRTVRGTVGCFEPSIRVCR